MKLIINISDKAYELLRSKSELDNIAESIIANGTPIKTVTNAKEAEAYPIEQDGNRMQEFEKYLNSKLGGEEE